MRVLPVTAGPNQLQNFANVANLIAAVFFLFASLAPFVPLFNVSGQAEAEGGAEAAGALPRRGPE
jgi:hypothetical protein